MPTTIIKKQIRKPQKQERPGSEQKMRPQPVFDHPAQKGSNKLHNKVALITGGDSGIGKAVAILFAKEGADIAISYLSEKKDANETKDIIEQQYHKQCLLIAGDIAKEKHCKEVVKKTIAALGHIDILVNNAGLHFENKSLKKISTREMLKTFETNVFSMFWITKACLPHMKKGSCIINSASVTAYRGSPSLMDYAATKGAIVSFTRSLSANLIKKGIRVNGVAPGPVWTPLIASSFKSKKVAQHGSNAPMERAGQPVEIAPSYLFLACSDSGYISGQFLHPNGGEIING
ncbi:SDR family oxidoreductase [Agriterribacter sp.]|uniref:SDR family oxidoreductase n=1 Tax=Agriterribacter sp. TaxID=2821509 RepID=UPI002B61A66B|nr:SDR family oxidoreductase [Agriterribacter sp.]HRP57102.1 SDR family oxidoreductase [Agriterribacter sp.]